VKVISNSYIDAIIKDNYSLDSLNDFIAKVGTVFDRMVEMGLEDREEQLNIAFKIADSITKNKPILVEAGVGTGKTFAYLIPSIIKNRTVAKPIIVSTNSLVLQDQLFYKDLPKLEQIMDIQLDYMTAKGRENYVCQELFINNSQLAKLNLNPIERSDLKDLSEIQWKKICVPEVCTVHCAFKDMCTFFEQRKRFKTVRDLIICNHNLFFADLKKRLNNEPPLLPEAGILIFDEAHTLELIAQKSFGRSITKNEVVEALNSSQFYLNYGVDIINASLKQFNQFWNQVKKGINSNVEAGRFGLELTDSFLKLCQNLKANLNDVQIGLLQYTRANDIYEKNRNVAKISDCLENAITVLNNLINSDGCINWIEISGLKRKRIELWSTPRNIREILGQNLFSQSMPIVLTSATLSSGNSFDYITANLGISNFNQAKVASPFDYENNTIYYIPDDMPEFEYGNHTYLESATEKIKEVLKITKGSALVLFTSHESLDFVYREVGKKTPFTVLHQEQAAKQALLEQFKKDETSVLMATGSFWEGIDIPGKALICVIIVKLPFSPDDPLIKDKIERVAGRGGDPFKEIQIPDMILKLKQGAGRLIRSKTDFGLVAILDNRAISRPYSKDIFAALPKAKITNNLNEVSDFLNSFFTQVGF
jgi:ATP-dependent DNA helicase DinG